MRASRLVTATFVFLGVASSAANPGCSSSSNSAFTMDSGSGADSPTTHDDVFQPGSDAGHDGTVAEDAHKDGPLMLGMPDVARTEASFTSEGGFSDAKPDVATADACNPDAGPSTATPLKHLCIIYPVGMDSGNECDGFHDPPAPLPANGSTGNGFDDNCNGLVDEGCSCDSVGTTKTCYLVPATQTEAGVPVGWCAQNSKGPSLRAARRVHPAVERPVPRRAVAVRPGRLRRRRFQLRRGTGERPERLRLLDGSRACPTAPLTTVPYPNPSNLPLQRQRRGLVHQPGRRCHGDRLVVDAHRRRLRRHPPAPDLRHLRERGRDGDPIGMQSNTLGTSAKEHGIVAGTPLVTSSIYPRSR